MDDLDIGEDGTVRSRNRDIQIDLNGLAEGYAAEQIADVLRQHGIADALINVGGDVLALGRASDRPWRVGISSPQHEALAGAQLQRAGLIKYTRGMITVLDTVGLEAVACECYAIIRDAHEQKR